MKGFAGFPAGKQPVTPMPDLFFTDLLPHIDHLGELKVTLHIFWLLARKKGDCRYVGMEELLADKRFLDGLAPLDPIAAGFAPAQVLRDALERAVARGTLLAVTDADGPAQRAWYFVNTGKGRKAVEALRAGLWTPAEPGEPVRLDARRPNIFVLYEQNIGALTPMIAEKLMDAEQSYPASWIEEAFREAVELNKRSWRYIEAILERWQREGRADEASRRTDEGDWRRFLDSEYADYIEP